MKSNVKAFFFLLVVIVAAVALAVFVREWNARMVSSIQTGAVHDEESTSTAVTPAHDVLFVPTSTSVTEGLSVFVSDDKITSVGVVEQHMSNPFHFFVTTTAFENTASWKLLQQNGKVLGSGIINVLSPDVGVPGPASVTGFYDVVPTMSSGTLMVYEASAKDGEPIHVVKIPVSLEMSTSSVKAFFSNAKQGADLDCVKVFGLTHTVVGGAKVWRLAVAMHELLRGPTTFERTRGYLTQLPEGVRQPLIQEWEGGVIEADFDQSLDQGVAGSCRVQAIRAQLEQTLKQWDARTNVSLSINGQHEGILQP